MEQKVNSKARLLKTDENELLHRSETSTLDPAWMNELPNPTPCERVWATKSDFFPTASSIWLWSDSGKSWLRTPLTIIPVVFPQKKNPYIKVGNLPFRTCQMVVQTRCKQLVEALSADFSNRLLQVVRGWDRRRCGCWFPSSSENDTWETTGSKTVSEGLVQRYGTIIIINHFFSIIIKKLQLLIISILLYFIV